MIHSHVLVVDDEPDIREIVAISLGLDPSFVLRSCGSGGEALEVAREWRPDLVLLDVMMPVMDGPTTLAQLRADRRTASIPVIFMTARTQARECEHFVGLGAVGVIAKPFDPIALPAQVRKYVPGAAVPPPVCEEFFHRVDADAAVLAECRSRLAGARDARTLERIKEVAHALAGASRVCGFAGMGCESADLEEAVTVDLTGHGAATEVEHALDRLLARIEQP
jgi:CheY-like chemotaxis protein